MLSLMPAASRFVLLAVLVAALVVGLAPVAASAADDPQDQIVLSGRVIVPRGEVVGQVVVLHGSVSVSGVVRGDVVVIDGRIDVLGQVSGSVVAVNGPVLLGPNAQVGGDVIARGSVVAKPGAMVQGRIRQGAAFTFRTPISALGRFAGWLAVSVSTLLLGLLLIFIAPRGADAVFDSARTALWASLGWGVAVFLGLPILSVLALVSLVGLPFGLALLLALAFLYFTGYAWGAWTAGRLILRPPRNRALAFLVGWAILRAVGLIPVLDLATWVAGAVFGLGAMTVAVWRARRNRGKHREGQGARWQGGVI